jgi:glyoxylase-like metal-dependent hydrolase (beta-lactamase superfamily II)
MAIRPLSGRRAARTLRHPWFYVEEVLPRVLLLGEPQHVNSWLVEGSDRAVLLDTGLGVAPIRPVAEALTTRPISVVNTHYHFDHVGGNAEFDDIAIHSIGAPLIEAEVPSDVLHSYASYARRQMEALDAFRELDDEFFWLLSAGSTPRSFPPGFDPREWTITGSRASSTLDDEDRVDLGDRALTVLHTPGHSPDMISLLDERDGILFAADAFNLGPVYCHFPDSDLESLAASARRYAELASEVRIVICHHHHRAIAQSGLLRSYADDVERTLAGDIPLTEARDVLEDPCLEASFDHYSITLPDPSAAPRDLNAPGPPGRLLD